MRVINGKRKCVCVRVCVGLFVDVCVCPDYLLFAFLAISHSGSHQGMPRWTWHVRSITAHTHTHKATHTHSAEPLALPPAGVISFPPAVLMDSIKPDVPRKHTHTNTHWAAFCWCEFFSLWPNYLPHFSHSWSTFLSPHIHLSSSSLKLFLLFVFDIQGLWF